jgi:hypothetical protein
VKEDSERKKENNVIYFYDGSSQVAFICRNNLTYNFL